VSTTGPGDDQIHAGPGADWIEGNEGDDVIDCGTQEFGRPGGGGPLFADGQRDIVNFNAGDGDDVVFNFGAGFFVIPGPPPGPGLPPDQIELFHDVLRIENVGTLTTEVINGGTLVQNGAGSVFLVGVTVTLAQSVDGNYLLLFDAT
jgi:Ca2+-binding RTX toxin-like protein